MKQYYINLNSSPQHPVVLYTNSAEISRAEPWKTDICWKYLKDNAHAPLESIINCLTDEAAEHLIAQCDTPENEKNISLLLLELTIRYFLELHYELLGEIYDKGINKPADLIKILKNYRNQVMRLNIDNPQLSSAFLSPQTATALTRIAEAVAAGASRKDIVATINKNQLSHYFSTTTRLPANFPLNKITKALQKKLPEKQAYTKFYNKFIKDFDARLEKMVQQLTKPVFQQKETYKNFPGVVSGKCWAATTDLPRLDLPSCFYEPDLSQGLEKYPNGFIVRENRNHKERVVLPNFEKIKTKLGAELFASAPLETDIMEIFTEKDPEARLILFITLFEDYLKGQIEDSAKKSKDRGPVCDWIIISRESLVEVLPPERGIQLDRQLMQQIKNIENYLKKKSQGIPQKTYRAGLRRRLEFLQQKNLAKCIRLNQKLAKKLASANNNSQQELDLATSQAQELAARVTAQAQITRELNHLKSEKSNSSPREVGESGRPTARILE